MNKLAYWGVFLFFIGSTLADSENMIPCLAIITLGLGLGVIGINRFMKGEKDGSGT